jgi:DNA polymerase/3'-5' exonuclease PolX
MNRTKAERVLNRLARQLTGARWVAVGSFRRGKEVRLHDIDVLVEDEERAGQRHRVWVLGEPVDVVYTAPECWGPALCYLTGSKEENIRLRAIAKRQGLLLNQYGVWRVTPKRRRRLDDNTEQGVYAALGVPYVEPEAR